MVLIMVGFFTIGKITYYLSYTYGQQVAISIVSLSSTMAQNILDNVLIIVCGLLWYIVYIICDIYTVNSVNYNCPQNVNRVL